MLRFEWDERKNKRNRSKRGVWFEEAQTVFDDPRGRLFHDPADSNAEERFTFGWGSAGRILVVVRWDRENELLIGIISARKATKRSCEAMR